MHYAVSSSSWSMIQSWHWSKGAREAKQSCLAFSGSQNVLWQKSAVAKVPSSSSLLPTCLLIFLDSKEQCCQRSNSVGLLKCEKLPPSAFPFYAITALTTAHCHHHDKPKELVHTPLRLLTPEPKRITFYFPVKYPFSHGQQDAERILTNLSTRLNKCPGVGTQSPASERLKLQLGV